MDTPGYYRGTFQGAGTDTANKNNTPFLCLTFNITHIGQDGKWVEQAPFNRDVKFCISDGVWNSPQAKGILLEQLAALGFNGNFEAPEFTSDLLVDGTTLVAEQDGEYARWKIDGLGGPREKQAVGTDMARTLNARYQAAATTATPPAAAPTPPVASAPPAPPVGGPQAPPAEDGPGGDNIPF